MSGEYARSMSQRSDGTGACTSAAATAFAQNPAKPAHADLFTLSSDFTEALLYGNRRMGKLAGGNAATPHVIAKTSPAYVTHSIWPHGPMHDSVDVMVSSKWLGLLSLVLDGRSMHL